MLRRIFGILVALSAWYCGMSIKKIAVLGSIWLIILFVVIPIVFRSSSFLQRHMVFLPYVHWPKHINFRRPETEGLMGTRNFYLETDNKVKVGVWHILPNYLIHQSIGKSTEWFEERMRDGNPIIIYMHGNTGSRAREHRIHLYRVLQSLNFHVIAFDYRGYADSSPVVPTKTGVIRDAHSIYNYVSTIVESSSSIFIYGHSLGTGVSTQFLAEVCQGQCSSKPKALILESPFNNIHDEIKSHPMSFLWRKMPWFEWFFAGTLTKNDVGFVSDQHIKSIDLPILILHAKDDVVVPFHLGEKLFEVALVSNKDKVQFVSFEPEEGLGHTLIYSSKRVPAILNNFIVKHSDRHKNGSNLMTML